MASRRSDTSPKSKTQFLFVHHDSTNHDSREDSKKVNAHVQVIYRKRKRGVNERWEPNLRAKARQLKLKMRDGEFVDQGGRVRRKKAHKSQTNDNAQYDARTSKFSVTAFSVQKGNSDPFSSMPIPVGPIINLILSWHSTQGIPALHPVESAILESPTPSARRTWAHTVFSVQNPGLVYPYLASVCALMVKRTEHQHLRNISLQLKDRAYVELRKALSAPHVIADFVTRSMILNMFWVELATDGPSAARTHLNMLDWIIRSSHTAIELPSECRLKFLAADTNLAVSQMQMTVADARDCSVERLFEDWKGSLSWQMNEFVVLKSLGLHTSIEDQELRSVFMRLRELIAVTELVAQGKIRDNAVFQWMDARLLSCEMQLVALCIEHRSVRWGSSTTEQDWQKRCISLAALTWISSTWASSNRGMGPTMVKRLKETLQEGSRLGRGVTVPEDLILWILYAGAALESRGTSSTSLNTWFPGHLKARVEKMGLPHATVALKRFLYSEGVCPLNLWQGRQ